MTYSPIVKGPKAYPSDSANELRTVKSFMRRRLLWIMNPKRANLVEANEFAAIAKWRCR